MFRPFGPVRRGARTRPRSSRLRGWTALFVTVAVTGAGLLAAAGPATAATPAPIPLTSASCPTDIQ
ncbi:hypothetical protein GA0115240_15581, partial [Streptomyces sp. DvalAA-14]